MTDLKISDLKARMIYDSRGLPTVEVDLLLNDHHMARSSVPSGASIGSKEALELRDNDHKRFRGKGVAQAIENINQIIAPRIKSRSFDGQPELDQFLIELDGTDNKSNLGANALLPVSMAFAKALAAAKGVEFYSRDDDDYTLPVPLMNLINGGAHASNNLAIQEFMIMPIGFDSFSESLRAGSEIFAALKSILHRKNLSTAVDNKKKYAPNLDNEKQAFDMLMDAINDAGYIPGKDIFLALDVAASNFYRNGKYYINSDELSAEELISYFKKLLNEYPIFSIEDPFAEDDLRAWADFSQDMRAKVQIVGDDLFVSSSSLLQEGIDLKIANSIIIKPNQIGTFTETINTIKLAAKNNYGTIISHRSGETEDLAIAHMAIAFGTGQIKTGSICRSERVMKYNEILRIEERLGEKAKFYGRELLKRFI